MPKYKMIACDLDGTLFGSDSVLSKENNKAIKEIVNKGIPFVPCTGRTLSEFREVAEHPDVRYIIYSAGAAIMDKQTGERIQNGLSNEMKANILDILSHFDCFPFIHADGKCYVDRALDGMGKKYNLNDILCCSAALAISIDNFNDFFMETEAEYFSVFFKSSEDHKKCREMLMQDESILMAEPWPLNIEIFNKKAGKDSALRILAKKLGIDMSEVISIGDSDNDIAALKAAGLGIAVSNGTDAIKEIADEIACSNDEHIAEYVLKKYFQGEEQ